MDLIRHGGVPLCGGAGLWSGASSELGRERVLRLFRRCVIAASRGVIGTSPRRRAPSSDAGTQACTSLCHRPPFVGARYTSQQRSGGWRRAGGAARAGRPSTPTSVSFCSTHLKRISLFFFVEALIYELGGLYFFYKYFHDIIYKLYFHPTQQ